MGLTEEERKSLVDYKLEKAKETIAEIPILIENELWRNAANRLYYACFYAVSALLLKHGYIVRTHGGAKGLLGKHFILTNIISREQNKLYEKLFDLRQKGDYDDWIIVEESDIIPLLEPAEKFISEIENLINEKIGI
jgi:uncharacterized protein (UPF0332 family)